MTQFTKADLATRILQDLSVIGAAETPQPEDLQFVEDTIDSEFALMEADGIKFWNTGPNGIDAAYFTQLSRRIGLVVGPTFGVLSVADAQNAIEAANDVLRRIGVDVKNPEELKTDSGLRSTRLGSGLTATGWANL